MKTELSLLTSNYHLLGLYSLKQNFFLEELFFALCTINRNKKDTTAFVFVLLFLTLGVKFIHSTKLIYNLLQYFKGYASLEF